MSNPADTPNGATPQAAAQPAPRGVVLLVYAMGGAILVMVALLILGLSLGWHKKGGEAPAAADPTAPRAAASAPAEAPGGAVVPLEVETAAESRLYTIAGSGDRVALHVAAPTGDEIIVIDTAANRVISRILLKPKGGPGPR